MGMGDLPGGAFESEAYGVSADGNTVVGSGERNGAIEACVAVVSEPSSMARCSRLAFLRCCVDACGGIELTTRPNKFGQHLRVFRHVGEKTF